MVVSRAGLSTAAGGAQPDADERIEIVPWPLDRLDDAIASCQDAKSLIALLWLAAERARLAEVRAAPAEPSVAR